jgi:large subunit ribosomal protein L23
MSIHNIIIKPLVTEKSMNDVSEGKYTFAVALGATKENIRNAIKETFHVKVASVATSIVKGKRKRVGQRRQEVKQTGWKKAMVTLVKGEKISLFEAGTEEEKKKK